MITENLVTVKKKQKEGGIFFLAHIKRLLQCSTVLPGSGKTKFPGSSASGAEL